MAVRYQNWRDDYQSRLKSPDQAVEVINEGDLVSITILCPAPLVAAFVGRAQKLGRVDFRTLAPGNPDLFNPAAIKGEKEIEIFIGDTMRPAHDAKVATYLPNTFMLGMKAFDAGREEARMPDVFLTPCSPPNAVRRAYTGRVTWVADGMERLWSPWRLSYVTGTTTPSDACVFCSVSLRCHIQLSSSADLARCCWLTEISNWLVSLRCISMTSTRPRNAESVKQVSRFCARPDGAWLLSSLVGRIQSPESIANRHPCPLVQCANSAA